MTKFRLILFLFCCTISSIAYSQQPDWEVTAAYNGLDWSAFVSKIEKTYPLRFFYEDASIADFRPAQLTSPLPLAVFLEQQLPNTYAAFDKQGHVFITEEIQINTQLPESIYPGIVETVSESNPNTTINNDFLRTSNEHIAKVITIGDKQTGARNSKATIRGYIKDLTENTAVIGATILVEELGTGTASEANGYYELNLKKGTYTLVFNDINHLEKKVKINLLSDGSHDFLLESKTILLEGVTVVSDKFDRVQSTKMGFERLTVKSIEEVPLVLGEKDILKVASLLAGVQSVGEGAAGFNVRGSPADQNLFYVDKVPVYNTSHLFGFFSAFNSQGISEFALSKSSIPAKFGGRLASIFDITALEGDKEKYKVRGGISPITGNILFEGPIQKEKSSVMIGLRSTYSNWILKLIKNDDFKNTRVNFADAMIKLSQNLSAKSKLQAFGYFSYDNIDFAGKTQFDNNNLGGSLSWSHFFNESVNLNLAFVYSRMQLEVDNHETQLDAYLQNNGLLHREFRMDWAWRIHPNHQLELGANAIIYDIDRGNFVPSGTGSLISPVDLDTERGLESGLYISDEWRISDALTLVGGLRFNQYNYLGPQSIYKYQDGFPKNEETITDSLQFKKGENIQAYNGLDYRISAKYLLKPNISIKASYNTLHQYIFLLSNTIALAPTDKWKLSDYNIKPMTGQQTSLGLYGNSNNKKLEWSAEAYYKKVAQLVEYRDGADLLINEFPERDILQGDLNAWGLELMLKKPSGRINGWINYTYSRAKALVKGETEENYINFGASYPTNYDKPHAINMVGNYKFTRRFSVSANLVYQTGKPITYPTTVYFQNGIQLINYTNRNEYRVPDYFRMDFSAKVEGNLKKDKLLHGAWVVSIYNVTGRNNAYNVYFKSNNGQLSGYKVSIFAHPIFSISYQFKFGNYDN